MILIQKTINAVVNKISTEAWNLESPYYNKIYSISPPNYAIRKKYGGYCRLDFGDYSCVPDLFDNDWPPPVTCAVSMLYSATTEAAATTIFTGNAHLVSINREQVRYETYAASNAYVLPNGEIFADTLVNVFAWICHADRMNLTLNTTLARDPSPAVVYTTSGEQLGVDFLDNLTAFFSHMFYISGSTLYLVDMAADNGTRTLTEHEFFSPSEAPVEYFYSPPCAIAKAGNFSQQSAYLYGNEIAETDFHGTQANVEAALVNIIAYQNAARAKLAIPITATLPAPGEKISWTDTSLSVSTDMWIRARIIQYDFDNDQIIVEGEGAVSAT